MKKLLLAIALSWFMPHFVIAQECGTTLSLADEKQYSDWVNTVEKQFKGSAQKGTIRDIPVKIHIVRNSNGYNGISSLRAQNDINQANILFSQAADSFLPSHRPSTSFFPSLRNPTAIYMVLFITLEFSLTLKTIPSIHVIK